MAMIRVREEVRKALKGKKLYKKESYNDILTRLMKRRSFRESTPMSRELKLKRALRRKRSSVGMTFPSEKALNDYMHGRNPSAIAKNLKVVQDRKLIRGMA